MTRSALRTAWIVGVAVTLAWGAGAFGSNYPWAYTPLLVACAILGVIGLLVGRGTPLPWPVAAGLAGIAAATSIQLVPLPLTTLGKVSPAALEILVRRDLAVSTQLVGTHPLSIDPGRTRLGLLFLFAFGVLLLGTARIVTREGARTLAAGIAILGAGLAVTGIVQRATFNGKIYGFWTPYFGGSPFGPFVNRNHFAGWMLMGVPLVVGFFSANVARGMHNVKPTLRDRLLWFASPEANRGLLVGFALLIMALASWLTMSRSGMLGLAGALILAGVAMARHQKDKQRRVVMSGYLLFVAIVVVSWVGLDRVITKFSTGSMADDARYAIWTDTLRIARDFWLAGTGLNTYGVSTLFYQTALPNEHVAEAHNDYLQLASEGGVLLGVPIVATIAMFIVQVRRRLRADRGTIWWIRMGAVTGLVAIAVQSLVEFSLQMPGNAALFAVLAGLALHDSTR